MVQTARSSQLESEGSQVLSSLANLSQRLPILLQSGNATQGQGSDTVDDDVSDVMGVLRDVRETPTLLLQKHFLALEKSREFLADIMRDYQELLRHLRSFTSECVTLVDDALLEDESAVSEDDQLAAVAFPLQLQEWMETVLAMFEHEVLRKTRLVADLEYSDSTRLSTMYSQWSAQGAMGNIDSNYGTTLTLALDKVNDSVLTSANVCTVQTGLSLPRATTSSTLPTRQSKSNASKRKKKK